MLTCVMWHTMQACCCPSWEMCHLMCNILNRELSQIGVSQTHLKESRTYILNAAHLCPGEHLVGGRVYSVISPLLCNEGHQLRRMLKRERLANTAPVTCPYIHQQKNSEITRLCWFTILLHWNMVLKTLLRAPFSSFPQILLVFGCQGRASPGPLSCFERFARAVLGSDDKMTKEPPYRQMSSASFSGQPW